MVYVILVFFIFWYQNFVQLCLFLVSDNKFKVVMLTVIGPVNSSNDNSISDAIKRSGDISLTKNIALPERNTETTIAATKFENGHVKNTTCVWPEYGLLKEQPFDFHTDKENIPENSIIYVNQGYLTIKDNKRLLYADYFLLGQVIEAINPPEAIRNYVCKEHEVKL